VSANDMDVPFAEHVLINKNLNKKIKIKKIFISNPLSYAL
jgi:hypothetical protein